MGRWLAGIAATVISGLVILVVNQLLPDRQRGGSPGPGPTTVIIQQPAAPPASPGHGTPEGPAPAEPAPALSLPSTGSVPPPPPPLPEPEPEPASSASPAAPGPAAP